MQGKEGAKYNILPTNFGKDGYMNIYLYCKKDQNGLDLVGTSLSEI